MKPWRLKCLPNCRGFTLVEVMVSVVVVAILVATAIPVAGKYYKLARKVECQFSVIQFLNHQEFYYLENNTYWPARPGIVNHTSPWFRIGWNLGSRPDVPSRYRFLPVPVAGVPELEGMEFRREDNRGYRIRARNRHSPPHANRYHQYLRFELRTLEDFDNDGQQDIYRFRKENRQRVNNPSSAWNTNGQWRIDNKFWFPIEGCPPDTICTR
jgi:prepilin-type N-terminal cleavage/methylation domain-containing protein